MKLYALMMCYNEAIFLGRAIRELLTFCDHVVVMDNGSDDSTRHYLSQRVMPGVDGGRLTVIFNRQGDPVNYAFERNKMLGFVPEGAWALRWDPDELPTNGTKRYLRAFLEEDEADGNPHAGWSLPIWHIIHDPRKCLGVECGFPHRRLFRVQEGVKFVGGVHEQIWTPDPWGGILPESGMGFVHLSYWCAARLIRKDAHYATVPGSGFGPGDLLRRLDEWAYVDLPDYVEYDIDPVWMEQIRAS